MEDQSKKTATKPEPASPEAERGKKAIDAAKRADGKAPEHPEVRKEEDKDADQWRNEG